MNNTEPQDESADSNIPTVVVREVDGQLVIDDPIGLAVMRTVQKHNCLATFDANAERIRHFVRRMEELNLSPSESLVVIVNVDDPHGRPIAEALMPGYDWQPYRDRGEIPFARGLVMRAGVEQGIAIFDQEAADKLRGWEGVAVVVVDRGVAEVFSPLGLT